MFLGAPLGNGVPRDIGVVFQQSTSGGGSAELTAGSYCSNACFARVGATKFRRFGAHAQEH
jgi:hypothetical protein